MSVSYISAKKDPNWNYQYLIIPFVPNAPFLGGREKGGLGTNRVITLSPLMPGGNEKVTHT